MTLFLEKNMKYLVLAAIFVLAIYGVYRMGYNAHAEEVREYMEERKKKAAELTEEANVRIAEYEQEIDSITNEYLGDIQYLEDLLAIEKGKPPRVIQVCKPSPTPGEAPIVETIEIPEPTDVLKDTPELDVAWKIYNQFHKASDL